jgi:hypothetical protein
MIHRSMVRRSTINRSTINRSTINRSTINRSTINRSTIHRSAPKVTFDIQFLKKLFDAGAIIHSNNCNDILSRIIIHEDHYIHDEDIENNIKELLQLLIERGAKNNNSKFLDNAVRSQNIEHINLIVKSEIPPEPSTLTTAIWKQNSKILNLMCDYGAKPDNSQTDKNTMSIVTKYNSLESLHVVCAHGAKPDKTNTMNNTMTLAVRMKDMEKIKLVCQHGAVPNNDNFWYEYTSTFMYAVKTCDVEIIKEVMMQGAKPYILDWRVNSFYIYSRNKFSCKSIKSIDRMINLLMCSGEQISDNLMKRIAMNNKTYIGSKIKECYNLLNNYDNSSIEVIQRRDELKKNLVATMKELMSRDLIAKQTKINEIDSGLNCSIPLPCIEIIIVTN